MKVGPAGPAVVERPELWSDGLGSSTIFPVEACALLSSTRAVAAAGAVNGDIVLTVVDPTAGRILRHIRISGYGTPNLSGQPPIIPPFVVWGGMNRIDDTTVAVAAEHTRDNSLAAFRVDVETGTVETVNGPGGIIVLEQTGTTQRIQDTGGTYFDYTTNTLHFMYWSHYFGYPFPDFIFTAWRLSINFDTLTVTDSHPIYPNMGSNAGGAIGYYGTLPLPTLGGAIGCIDPGADTDTRTGRTLQVVDNHGNLLDTMPDDPTGNYYGNDRFFTQIAGTNDVALIYSRWNPDYPPSFSGGRPGDYDLWCRTYQVNPTFQALSGDFKLARWYDSRNGPQEGMDPPATALLGFNPYDQANYMTPLGCRFQIDADFGSNLMDPSDYSMEVPYEPFRGRQQLHLTVPFGPGDKTLLHWDFPFNTAANMGAWPASHALGPLIFAAMTQDFRRSYPAHVVDDYQTVYQLFTVTNSDGVRLDQRNDGRGTTGHPRLNRGSGTSSSQQTSGAPRVNRTNTYS